MTTTNIYRKTVDRRGWRQQERRDKRREVRAVIKLPGVSDSRVPSDQRPTRTKTQGADEVLVLSMFIL